MKFRLLISLFAILPFLIQCNTTKNVSSSDSSAVKTDSTGQYADADQNSDSIYTGDFEDSDEGGYATNDTIYSKWSTSVYHASAAKVNDLVNTKLEVSFDWAKAWMYGKATITLKPHFYPVSQLVLDAKGFEIKEISMVTPTGKMPLHYVYNTDTVPDTTQITIDLGKEYTRNDQYTIFIDYIAKPNSLPKGGSDAITEDKGLYFINNDGKIKDKPMEIWTQGETESNSAWFPTIDKPNQKCTDEIDITVDDKYQTLSNGLLVSSKKNADGTRTDDWKMDLPQSPYLFMMAIGEFSIVKDSWKNKDVNYYVEKKYEPYAKQIFGHTPQMIDYFSTILNYPFPWQKYDQVVVRDYVSGAMENTTATLHGEFLQQTSRELLDETYEDVISHELFHSWFGDLVTCESWSNIPLNESFATYGEYLWEEHEYGRDAADYLGYTDYQSYMNEAQYKNLNLIRFNYDSREDVFDSHSYAKGGRVLHMLREYLGDDAFFAGLNKYLNDNKFSSVEIENLRLAMESVSGQDLHWFFDEWFLNKGIPDLNIEYNYDADTKEEVVTVDQLQDTMNAPIYVLPVDVDIYANGTVQRQRITIDRSKQVFSFDCPVKPDLVNFDAQKMLLCTKTDNKDLETWLFQYNHAPLFLDRYEALEWCAQNQNEEPRAKDLVEQAMNDKFWAIRKFSIDTLMVDDNTPQTVKDKLMDMAVHDPKSAVRTSALTKLTQFHNINMLPTLEAAMNDSSYLVIGTAMSEIYALDPDKGAMYARQYQNEGNLNILPSVLDIIAKEGNPKDNDYFLSIFDKYTGYEIYFGLTNYETFLEKMNDFGIIQKGIDELNKLSDSDGPWWVAYFAGSAISNIREYYSENISSADAATHDAWQRSMDYIDKMMQDKYGSEDNNH